MRGSSRRSPPFSVSAYSSAGDFSDETANTISRSPTANESTWPGPVSIVGLPVFTSIAHTGRWPK